MTAQGLSRRAFCTGLGAACAAVALPGRAGAAPRNHPDYFPGTIGRSATHVCRYEDTLIDLAPAYDLGFDELAAANPGVDPWVPGAGRRVLLPGEHVLPDGPRRGILINLADMRLYYFPGLAGVVETCPVGTGRLAWNTPRGRTRIVRKQADPTWHVPASILKERPGQKRVVPPGPDNPLGRYAIHLGWPGYLIHGTNEPYSVGRQASHGCVHLYPADIAALFPLVAIGTPVTVVYQEAKIGRRAGVLLLEVHPSRKQADQIEAKGSFTPARIRGLGRRLVAAAGAQAPQIDWKLVERTVAERRGIPIPILRSDAAFVASS
jgi:L,D-transpeptidase ErfK/SrfK